MRMAILSFLLCSGSMLWYNTVQGQSSINPEISVIPRFKIESNDGERLPEVRKFSRPDFFLDEFELAIQGYLNPFARADIFLSKAGAHDEPIEIEEAYVSFLRGLPLDLNARIGKYLAEFGKLNTVHPHAWPFISKPISAERFLGEEGINDVGVSLSTLLPTGSSIYSQLTLELLKGNTIGTIHPDGTLDAGVGLADTVSGNVFYAGSGRLKTFFSLGEESDMEVGVSMLTGIHDPYHKFRFFYNNLDFKYKWKPDSYEALVIQGEALYNNRLLYAGNNEEGNVFSKRLESFGGYLMTNYQFLKMFHLGARYDWSESPYSKHDRMSGFAFFFGFQPVEETTAFCLEFNQRTTNTSSSSPIKVNTIILQVLFSLGPHKAHPF